MRPAMRHRRIFNEEWKQEKAAKDESNSEKTPLRVNIPTPGIRP